MSSERTARPAVRVDEVEAGILLVTLDRPARRNALDIETLTDLSDVFGAADARVVVLVGSGPAFCAGYDLASVAGPEFEQRAEELIAHPAHPAFETMESAKFPIIAAIDGPALGGGLELACCCDARIATRRSTFGIPAGDLGLVYSETGVRRFAAIWSGSLTREMMLFGRRLDADRAWQVGAIAELAEDGGHVDAALLIARRAAQLAPRATASNKQIVRAVLGPAPERAVLNARRLRRACFGSEGELRAGVEMFLQRDAPPSAVQSQSGA